MPQSSGFKFSILGDEGAKTVTIPSGRMDLWVGELTKQGIKLDDPDDPYQIIPELPESLVTRIYKESKIFTDPEESLPQIPILGLTSELPIGYSSIRDKPQWGGPFIPQKEDPAPAGIGQPPTSGGEEPTIAPYLKGFFGAIKQAGRGAFQTGIPFYELADPVKFAQPVRPELKELTEGKFFGIPESRVPGLGALGGLARALGNPIAEAVWRIGEEFPHPRFFKSVPQALVPLLGPYATTAAEEGFSGLPTDADDFGRIAYSLGLTFGAVFPGTGVPKLSKAAARRASIAKNRQLADFEEGERLVESAMGGETMIRFGPDPIPSRVPLLGAPSPTRKVGEIEVPFGMISQSPGVKFSRGVAGKVWTTRPRLERHYAEMNRALSDRMDEIVRSSELRLAGRDYVPDNVYGRELGDQIGQVKSLVAQRNVENYRILEEMLEGTDDFLYNPENARRVAQEYFIKWSDLRAGTDVLRGAPEDLADAVRLYANPGRGGRRIPGLEVEPHVVTRAMEGGPTGPLLPGEKVVQGIKGVDGKPLIPRTGEIVRPDLLERTVPRAPGGSIQTRDLAPAPRTYVLQNIREIQKLRLALRNSRLWDSDSGDFKVLAKNLLDALEEDTRVGVRLLQENDPKFRILPGEASLELRVDAVRLAYRDAVALENNFLVKKFIQAENREFLPGLFFGAEGRAGVGYDDLVELRRFMNERQAVAGKITTGKGSLPGGGKRTPAFTEDELRVLREQNDRIRREIEVSPLSPQARAETIGKLAAQERDYAARAWASDQSRLGERILSDGDFQRLGRRAIVGQMQKIIGKSNPEEWGSLALDPTSMILDGVRLEGDKLFKWISDQQTFQKIQYILGPEEAGRLKDVITIANRVNLDASNTQTGLIGGSIGFGIISAPLQALLGASIVAAASTSAAFGGLGEAFLIAATRPATAPKYMAFFRALETGQPQQIAMAAQHLIVEVNKELEKDSQGVPSQEVPEATSWDPSSSRRGGIDPRMLATGLGARLPGTQNWSGRRQ